MKKTPNINAATVTATAGVATVCPSDFGVTATWSELFKLIPGYDPVATAGDCSFRAEVADNAIEWIETELVHVEGECAGQPLKLEPWQKAFVGCLFGWFRPNGTRRYRRAFVYVPRKNGKSSLCAAMLLLVAFCDNEPGAQLYSAAAEREQAALIYRIASGMISRNAELSKGCRLYRTYKSIEFPGMTTYKALSSDAETKHGLNAHFIIKDELHAHRSRDLSDVLETSTGARRQPMIVTITTADYDRISICNEEYEQACRVRDGISTNNELLPVIFEAPKDCNIQDVKVWRVANPNLGISVSEEYLKAQAAKAVEIPSYRNTFKRLHLNIRTQTESVGIDLPKWDLCGGLAYDIESFAGKMCWLGLDLGSTRDLTAAVLCFPPDEKDGVYTLLPKLWIPKGTAVERERIDGVSYTAWHEQGFISYTEGYYRDATDYNEILKDIGEWTATYNIRAVIGDQWNATQLMTMIAEEYGIEVTKLSQTMTAMHEPTVEFEKLYVNKRLAHGNNPVLRWMAGNVVRLEKSGRVKFIKGGDKKRIDGIIAAIMGTAGALQKINGGETGSVYDREERGLLTI